MRKRGTPSSRPTTQPHDVQRRRGIHPLRQAIPSSEESDQTRTRGMEIRNRQGLITGGSSGIGLALAQVLGDPAALHRRFAGMKAVLEEGVRDHSAL